ncbi:MAG: hypothetical protein K5761_04540 [Clostridiales bacterium]|nr:hypothetical protein [Clostridiales bacterium]
MKIPPNELTEKIGGKAAVIKEEKYYSNIDKTGLQFSTKISMVVSDMLSMVKMVHLSL